MIQPLIYRRGEERTSRWQDPLIGLFFVNERSVFSYLGVESDDLLMKDFSRSSPNFWLTSARVRSTVPRPSPSSRSHSRINRSAPARSRSVFLCFTFDASFHSSGVNRCGRVTTLAIACSTVILSRCEFFVYSSDVKQLAINHRGYHRKVFRTPSSRCRSRCSDQWLAVFLLPLPLFASFSFSFFYCLFSSEKRSRRLLTRPVSATRENKRTFSIVKDGQMWLGWPKLTSLLRFSSETCRLHRTIWRFKAVSCVCLRRKNSRSLSNDVDRRKKVPNPCHDDRSTRRRDLRWTRRCHVEQRRWESKRNQRRSSPTIQIWWRIKLPVSKKKFVVSNDESKNWKRKSSICTNKSERKTNASPS